MIWLFVIPAIVVLPSVASTVFDLVRLRILTRACETEGKLIVLRQKAFDVLFHKGVSDDELVDLGEINKSTSELLQSTRLLQSELFVFRLKPRRFSLKTIPAPALRTKVGIALWGEILTAASSVAHA